MHKKRVSESRVKLTEIVFPEDTNPYGSLFGGRLVSLMDKAAFLCATRHARRNCVTASMDRLDFLAPIGEGYIVEIEAHINYVARSSMEIELNVSAEDTLSGKQVEACHAYFTLVALDSAGKPSPAPQLELQGEGEYKRFRAGKKRHQERLRTRVR